MPNGQFGNVDATQNTQSKTTCAALSYLASVPGYAVPRDYNPLISQATTTQCPPDPLMNQYFLVTYLYYVPDIIA